MSHDIRDQNKREQPIGAYSDEEAQDYDIVDQKLFDEENTSNIVDMPLGMMDERRSEDLPYAEAGSGQQGGFLGGPDRDKEGVSGVEPERGSRQGGGSYTGTKSGA